MEVAIRADGSNEMGYGHLTRSNAIATELLDFGESVTYLSKTPNAVASVCADQIDVRPLERGTPDEVVSKLRTIDADVAYMDLPEAPFKLQRTIRNVCPLGVFLGSARHKLCCDMLVNGHLFAEEEEYEWFGEEPIWCLGPKYLPLREPFPEIATRNVDCSKKPEKGIILMGGTDPHNLTPAGMEAFSPLNIEITVIVGPGNQNQSEIEKKARALDARFKIVRDPKNLPELMFDADIAVSGFGTTIYELMATRTPFIGIARTELEEETARRVKKYVDIPVFERDFDRLQLTNTLQDLLTTPERRLQLQTQFESHIDGKGALRIAEQIQSIASKKE